jgi:nucleoid DNA-binding protein
LNPQNRSAAPKYYLEAKSRGSIGIEELLDAICEDNTLNRDEARMALNIAFRKSGDFLRLGFNVDWGELGSMRTTLRSRGVDTEQEATAATVSDKVPHFVFGKKFRASLKQEKLERSAD